MPNSVPLSKEDAIEAVRESLQIGLHKIVEGAQADIREFALDLSQYAVKVAAEPDPKVRVKLLKSIRSQTKMLAELNRVRVVNEGYATAERVLATATTVLANILVKAAVPPPA